MLGKITNSYKIPEAILTFMGKFKKTAFALVLLTLVLALSAANAAHATGTVMSDSPTLAAPMVYSSVDSLFQDQNATLASMALTTGAPPYMYQWFSEAPFNTTYSPIVNATSPSYNFTTSPATVMGDWNFMLQVNDSTGASANTNIITIQVNAALPTFTPLISSSDVIYGSVTAAIAVVIVAAGLLVYFKKHKPQK